MKILAFAGSNSQHSINKKLAAFASSLFNGAEVKMLDLNDFIMPLYSDKLEKEKGVPPEADAFVNEIQQADMLVVSLAENNSSFNAAFKNHFDWISRKHKKQFFDKPMLLMATSPGKRGGASVLAHGNLIFPFHGANIKATFSLPSFNENFQEGKGIVDAGLLQQLRTAIASCI